MNEFVTVNKSRTVTVHGNFNRSIKTKGKDETEIENICKYAKEDGMCGVMYECRYDKSKYVGGEYCIRYEIGENRHKGKIQDRANCMKDEMVGFRYRHFKGGIYVVTDIAVHSETEEIMVIYKNFDEPNLSWCRPLSIFMSEVDREKYPYAKQNMRFERIGEDEQVE